MSVTRAWPVPRPGSTLHFIGDLHFSTSGFSAARQAATLADFTHPLVPAPLAHFQVGDLSDSGLSSQDADALAWLAQITDAPVYVAIGNHDVKDAIRTADEWAAAYTSHLPTQDKNYIVEFAEMVVIVLGPDGWSPGAGVELTQATLDYLDGRLAATEKDCWILCHPPLYNTVLGGATRFQSVDAGFFVKGPNGTDDTEVRAVLGSHTNAKAWICGHTHSEIHDPGFATLTTCGSRQVAHINASAFAYIGRVSTHQLASVYVTRVANGDIEVRYRNHGAQVWDDISGSRVTTLTPG